MESTESPLGPSEARAALADAESARAGLVGGLLLPSFFYSSIGSAIAVQTATGATGIARQDAAGMVLLAGGLVVFALAAGVQLARFRRLNGAWVGGLASQVLLGTAGWASVSYAAAFAAATWAAVAGVWWLVPAAAVAGGGLYIWSGRRWWHRYQGAPAEHSRGKNAVVLAIACTLALVFLVVLLASR